MTIVVVVAVLLVGAFVVGILVGRKNRKLVEKAVGVAKDPTSVIK